MRLQTGMIPGIVLQIVCAVVSIYTLYLLLILYLHRKSELVSSLHVMSCYQLFAQ